jgi:hypothetical protein
MAKGIQPVLRLKVRGPGIGKGRIPVPDLIRICQEAQAAIKKQAEAMEGRKTIHPGPVAAAILDECTLDLIGIKDGSATLEFAFTKPQLRLQEMEADAIGIQAISEVAASIKSLGNGNRRNIDPGVLQSVYGLCGIAKNGHLTSFEWIAPAAGKAKGRVVGSLNSTVQQRAAQRLSSPRHIDLHVDGILDMADFKPEEFKCRIDPAIGTSVICTFDQELADKVQKLLRSTVRASGLAKLAAYTDKIESIRLRSIDPLPSLSMGYDNFFQDSSLLGLADLQNVKPLKDLQKLAGAIPADADVDIFLEEIYIERK